jgi:hypothetical protein
MLGVYPTPKFARVKLEIATVASGEIFGRLYLARHADPLGFGKSRSRFSDPRRRVESNRFGVLYLGGSLNVCFLEAFLRDQRNGAIGDLPIAERELNIRSYAEIRVIETLRLVDLRGNAAIRMGVPSDVARASRHTLSRLWSLALHEHPEQPDGIIYLSRLNSETNLAIYDRAIKKLATHGVTPLIEVTGLANVLRGLNVALVASTP